MARAPGSGPGVGWRRHGLPTPTAVCGLCVVVAVAGCAGDGPPPATGSAYDAIQTGIFSVHCLGSGCHNITSRSGGLVLEPGLSYGNLVDVVPDNAAARDLGLLRVAPFDPAGSFLLTKLTGPGDGEGERMPRAASPLSSADINQIRDWILAGAPPPTTRTPIPTRVVSPTATPSPSATGVPDTPTASPSPTAGA